ncbi:unnamed protein product [Boreogadus saida]
MNWFGFGFNAFGQISDRGKPSQGDDDEQSYTCLTPIRLNHLGGREERAECQQGRVGTDQLSACWSRTASLCLHDQGRVFLSGFGADENGSHMSESLGCQDALLGERYLTLGFRDRVECWDVQRRDPAPAWSMESPSEEEAGASRRLPLVPGGYIASKPPFYRPLSPQLKAVSLALGAEHAILLSGSGTVYTWGIGSHGQLGHSGLTPEKEPRPVEALWGVPIDSVSTGGWHSTCVSAGGDLYVWGWNESGQLGLPSLAMRTSQEQKRFKGTASCQEAGPATRGEEQKEGESQDVFISIQAFPALLDITESCDVAKVSCGSRHTAAVTTTGDLYTWGWGEYGQLGHGTASSSDEPHCVDFFRQEGFRVVDVVCGPWNTFAMATKEEVAHS